MYLKLDKKKRSLPTITLVSFWGLILFVLTLKATVRYILTQLRQASLLLP